MMTSDDHNDDWITGDVTVSYGRSAQPSVCIYLYNY